MQQSYLETWYIYSMVNNSFNTNARPTNWKRVAIIFAGIVVAILITTIIFSMVRQDSLKYENNGGYFNINYQKVDEFSDILNIYYNLPSEMPEDFFNEILDSGEVNRDYVQINEGGGESYIATFHVTPETDFSQQNVEFISFDYTPGDGETEAPMISDVTYHSFRDGKHDSIQETEVGIYTHTSDDLDNSYDDKASAIDSFLMTIR